MNKSEVLRLMKRILLFFPLLFVMTMPYTIRIALMILWLFSLLFYLYPDILTYFALILHEKKGKDGYFKIMSYAYGSGRLKPETAATYSYMLLRDGELEKSSEVLDYAELAALEQKDWRKGGPRYNHVHSYRALILWKQDRLDDASDLLLNLLNDDYKTSTLYVNLGWFLLKQDKLAEALDINLEALDYDRSDSILDNLGLNYLRLENLEKSREIYEELIKNDPSFPDAWFNYGSLLEREGDYEKAQKMFRKALSCNFSFLGTITRTEVEQAVRK